jgi:glucan endo-1,3-alpha-glucosidase
MVAWPRGGPQATVASYQAEFRDAHARGIDGFALNCGGWDASEPHYKRRVLRLYDAPADLDFDFKLFVPAGGRAQDELKDIVATTRGLKAQLRVDGKPVLSAYAAGGKGFTDSTALASEAESLGAFFVPDFFPATGEPPDLRARSRSGRAASWQCERLFLLRRGGCTGPDREFHRSAQRGTQDSRQRIHGAGHAVYRALPAGTNYRAFETSGFSGMATEREAAIASGATWVQIVTWNDWAESTCAAPIEPVAPIGGTGRAHVYHDRFGDLLSHTAYLDASEYYIQWFKSGNKPVIARDRLFYFYRLNPLGREPRLGLGAHDANTPPRAQEPLSSQIHDQFRTAPAVLVVTLAGSATRFDMPAGLTLSNARAFTPRFVLQQHGETLIDKAGEQAITDDDFSGRYNYFSGSADA